MFGLQPLHLILIAIIALLLFGPARLADLGRGIAKMFSEFRAATKEETLHNTENVKSNSKKQKPPKAG